jgi:putative PIN family toxin of toxin-antitoxin system
VIISAFLLPNSVAAQTFRKLRKQGKLLLSFPISDELEDVIRRKKFDRYATPEARLQFLKTIIQEAIFIEITVSVNDCRDLRDNKFLELALSGQAECIISGDDDLLVLHPYKGVRIINPRTFLDEETP